MMTPNPGFPVRLALAAGVLAVAAGGRAAAQSIDYGALEQLFGEPVTLSVTGKPQRATDAPANIDIITQDDIRRSGATDIPGVLQFVTGLDVRRSGLAGADVGMRGYNQADNPRLMVLVDGRQVYMVDYGRIPWATLPVQLTEIRQIEVIRGPNSALYGFNAVGGVINIITCDPLHEPVTVASADGGTQNYAAGSAVATGRIGETAGLRLSLGGFRASDFPPGPLAEADALSRRNPYTGTLNADGRWQITPGIEAFLTAGAGDTRVPQISPAGAYDTESLHTNAVRVGLNAESGIGLLSLSAYRNEALVSVFADTASPGPMPVLAPSDFHERQIITVLQASDLVKLGTDHTVRIAVELRQNADNSALLSGSASNLIYAASLMWDWQMRPDLSVTNALRLDYVQLDYHGTPLPGAPFTRAQFDATTLSEPSFNSGVVWKATGQDTLRLTAARGVQLPTLMEQALQVPFGQVGPAAFYGRPNLNPSVIWNVELDYDRALPALDSTLRTAVFGQRIDDIIAWPFGGALSIGPGGIPSFTSENAGYSTAAGLEVGIKGHAESGWRWNASYSLATTTDHTVLNQGSPVTSVVEYAHSAPRNVVIAGIGYSRGRWEADLLARWQSSYLDFRMAPGFAGLQLVPVTVQNYVTANGRIAYRVMDNVTLALTLQQFNQARIAETAGPLIERRLILNATVRF
jgi:iron complex outermembrane receptor protein